MSIRPRSVSPSEAHAPRTLAREPRDLAPRGGVSFRRRDVVRMLAVGAAMGTSWTLREPLGQGSVLRTGILMGTPIRMKLLGEDPAAMNAAADAAFMRMNALERHLSRFVPDSDVSRLNAEGRVVPRLPDLASLLVRCRELYRLGEGAFDATVQPLCALYQHRAAEQHRLPGGSEIEEALERVDASRLSLDSGTVALTRSGMQLTLDGIGKGYVLDEGIEVLRQAGFPNLYLEAGGDLIARGRKPGGDAWILGIQHPRARGLHARFEIVGESAAELSVRDAASSANRVAGCAVATSGDYLQRFTADCTQHHILDPRSGYSAPELASATVVASDATWADGLATLVMVLGARVGRDLLEALPGCEGYLITKDLDVVKTTGFHLL